MNRGPEIVSAAVLLAAALSAPAAARADCDDPFTNPDDVLDIHLRMPSDVWNEIVFDEPVAGGDCAQFPTHVAEFRCGPDEPWILIGARHKRGEQRGAETDRKPSVKLDFNWVTGLEDQRWPEVMGRSGYRKLSLNTGQADAPGNLLAVLLTEHLAWRLLADEVPTVSRVAYARLYVHLSDADDRVEYHGLYILLEDLDHGALKRRYDRGRGILEKYTGSDCDGVDYDDTPPGGVNLGREGFLAWQVLDPAAYGGTWVDETDRALDLEELLRQEVIRDILVNDDNITNADNNYYIFDPDDGRRHYLPWDLDDSFRVLERYSPDTPLLGRCSPLGERTTCQPAIRARALEIACQLVNGTLRAESVLDRLAGLDELVRPIVEEEVVPVWGGRDPFDPDEPGSYQATLDFLQEWVPRRIDSIREQLAAEGLDCPDRCEEGESEACSFGQCSGQRVCEQGAWTACRSVEGSCELQGSDAGPSDAALPTEDGSRGAAGGVAGGGCGCAMVPPHRLPAAPAWWIALLAIAGSRRRRRGFGPA